MVKVGILGAKGYTAGELLRIFLGHPEVEVTCLQARVESPTPVGAYFSFLRGRFPDLMIEPIDLNSFCGNVRVAFLGVPHKTSQEYAAPLLEAGIKVIDLSADFRFRNIATYEKTYNLTHAAPELNREAVYGLPELYREQIKSARLIASPGCYPTSVILACAPFMKHPAIDPQSIIADSKSGVSGAGRAPTDTTHFPECNEAVRPYHVGVHRHQPEIEEKLSEQLGSPVRITFTPHLVPMDRGILSTIYLQLTREEKEDNLRRHLAEFYKSEPFIRILPEGVYPSTKDVVYTNFCDIGLKLDAGTRRLILMSAIDNLTKGASGQAVQAMNLQCGFPETLGLL
ncbi:MAG: N-acetyl-gamma-glutamyl-phosphate reductase [bacterium]